MALGAFPTPMAVTCAICPRVYLDSSRNVSVCCKCSKRKLHSKQSESGRLHRLSSDIGRRLGGGPTILAFAGVVASVAGNCSNGSRRETLAPAAFGTGSSSRYPWQRLVGWLVGWEYRFQPLCCAWVLGGVLETVVTHCDCISYSLPTHIGSTCATTVAVRPKEQARVVSALKAFFANALAATRLASEWHSLSTFLSLSWAAFWERKPFGRNIFLDH